MDLEEGLVVQGLGFLRNATWLLLVNKEFGGGALQNNHMLFYISQCPLQVVHVMCLALSKRDVYHFQVKPVMDTVRPSYLSALLPLSFEFHCSR